MIDRPSRDKFAELLRQLAAGQISNDEFENNFPIKSKDKAVNNIFWNGAWLLYDDRREYKLIGKHRLSKSTKQEVARWILFLKSDFEYSQPRWVQILSFLYPLLAVISLGLVALVVTYGLGIKSKRKIWPFENQEDFEFSLKHPVYLNAQPNPSINRDG